MSIDYEIFYRRQIDSASDWDLIPAWDVFLSAYNKSDRVREVYNNVKASRKFWILHPEYRISTSDYPVEGVIEADGVDESAAIRRIFDDLEQSGDFVPGATSLCVDITGMLRPHILFLMLYLKRRGQRKVAFVYAEPVRYVAKEHTPFALGQIAEVRAVHGFEGSPNLEATNDILVIGMGYDDRMIREVAEDREKARKVQLFGLPPLRADMYQQSVIRSRNVADAVGDPEFAERNRASAPAGDPFATASVLKDLVGRIQKSANITNLYLSPVGTKAQVLGFGLYYIGECLDGNASIIFPFSEGYEPETSVGFHRAWLYVVEFAED